MLSELKPLTVMLLALFVSSCTVNSQPHPENGDADMSGRPKAKTAGAITPGYRVTLSGIKDQLFCDNCGNSGKSVPVQGGSHLSQYDMMVDTPFYTFLRHNAEAALVTNAWAYINKSAALPILKNTSLGNTSAVKNIIPENDVYKTRLHVEYFSGERKTFEFENQDTQSR